MYFYGKEVHWVDKLVIGVDIGGTATKIGLINLSGDIIYKWEIPTNTNNLGDSVIEDVWTSIVGNLSKQINKIIGIGVGAPGFINPEKGVVYEAVNIGWKNLNLKLELERLSDLPVFIENDANLAALGENWTGSGDNSKDVILVTLGTGVGSGLIANGDVISGTNGTAGEIGHTTINPNGYLCNCGGRGCLETIASATGIVQQAKDKIAEYPTSRLASHYEKHGKIGTKDIFELADNGDEISENIIEHTTDILGYSLANTATIMNPSRLIIGGGVSNAGEQLLSKIKSNFQKYALPRISNGCEVKLAQLGNDAGIIGAAYLVKRNLNNDKRKLI